MILRSQSRYILLITGIFVMWWLLLAMIKKKLVSTKGHKLAATSAFFERRLEIHKEKMKQIKESLHKKTSNSLEKLLKRKPRITRNLYYIAAFTYLFIAGNAARDAPGEKVARKKACQFISTLNTGQDIHLICEKKNAKKVSRLAEKLRRSKKQLLIIQVTVLN